MIILNSTYNSCFCFFNKNNCLYIKNDSGDMKKLSSNIYTYSATIDNINVIHICFIDLKGFFNYCIYEDNNLLSISKLKLNGAVKKNKNLSLYILNNSLNVFFAKHLNHNTYNIHHLHYNLKTYDLSYNIINDVYKSNNSIYKVKISNNEIICSYNNTPTGEVNIQSVIFDNLSKSWLKFSNTKINNLLFNYYDSIKYE
ncbi:MAG: hypothetical protein ACRCYC_07360 [Paraclostridium sp.]|uniref:hypothetical protein n=1 Tax=Paraclostridium sp. TaxID=2023273 RepID=UPI003F3DA2A6